jgi:hypothetical protein
VISGQEALGRRQKAVGSNLVDRRQ